MTGAITTIPLSGVNCYLLAADGAGDASGVGSDGAGGTPSGAGSGRFVLIDTGLATKRAALVARLREAGCLPGTLALVLLTHGDVDHAGNAKHLRDVYGAKVGIHPDDAPMIETGDMDLGRKPVPDRVTMTGRFIRVAGTLMELTRRGDALGTLTPDLLVDEDFDLSPYGLDARVLHLPGHSRGSIGVLTASGDLFCGDLLYHWRKVSVPIMDDAAAHAASMAKLRRLDVKTVYPGHGKPFAWQG